LVEVTQQTHENISRTMQLYIRLSLMYSQQYELENPMKENSLHSWCNIIIFWEL